MSHGRLTTLLVTAGTVALVIGVGFGVQAAGLGRTRTNPQLVARVLRKLIPYTVARARMTIDGTRLNGVCTAHVVGRHRIVTVAFDGGPTLHEVTDHLLSRGRLALGEFELAGCPRALRKWLTQQLNQGGPIRVAPTRFDGLHVLGIRFPSASLKLEVFVSRQGLFPVALTLHDPGVWGASRIVYGARAPGSSAGGQS